MLPLAPQKDQMTCRSRLQLLATWYRHAITPHSRVPMAQEHCQAICAKGLVQLPPSPHGSFLRLSQQVELIHLSFMLIDS